MDRRHLTCGSSGPRPRATPCDGTAAAEPPGRWAKMFTGDGSIRRFVLEAIDPQTECVSMEVKFEITEPSEIGDLIGSDAAAAVLEGADCDLEPDEVGKFRTRFNLAFEPGDLTVRLRTTSHLDDLPYQVHTGRELAFMLKGTKPLAAFWGAYPSIPDREEIPERLFDPYVAAGRFVKRERVFEARPSEVVGGELRHATRIVLYALPQEAWRIDAYLLLQDTAAKSGWNEGFERMQGSLLGYDQWENDIFIERCYRPAVRSRRAS
jgi:hypothetical protein